MAETFDVIVLGTGSGGAGAARRCRAAGLTVAIVDDQPYGGTCALRGCDPKKVLVGAADVLDWQHRMRGYGVSGAAALDWGALMRFKRTFTDPVPFKAEAGFDAAGIVPLHGAARFIAEDRLVVGSRELAARHIVIATGASPRPLNMPGEELVISSTQFLELDALPPRVAFVGAGYISLEFAHVARRAGSAVTILGSGVLLPGFDDAVVARLVKHTRDVGIDIRLETTVTGVERVESSGACRLHARRGETRQAIDVDLVVHGAGRSPNTARIDATAGRIALDEHGAVAVNAFLQSTTNPRVYAAGDVTRPPGSLPLTPVAGHEGQIVASNILHGNTKHPDYRAIPSVVFTLPALAGVGLTEAEARQRDLPIRVKQEETSGWYANRRVREPAAMFKTIVNADTDLVIGAHLLGSHAEEVINLFAFAIRFGIPTAELKHMIFAYPTNGSDIAYML